MKKYLKIFLSVISLAILLFLGYQIILKINHKNEITQNIKTVPQFSYQNINGGFFTNENLKKKTNTIFIYFNTECEYCNEETKMISENIKHFKNIQIIFISFENLDKIKKFAHYYKLSNHDNVHFLSDSKITFSSTFDVKSLPCIILYDKNQKIIEKITGQTKPEILIKKLNIK